MAYQVLAIGYKLIEQAETRKQWDKCDVKLEFADSAWRAVISYYIIRFYINIIVSLLVYFC